jgi:hypothetical protein
MDITITASRRSQVLRKTLESFKTNLLGDLPCRVIINIDPVGVDEAPEFCLDVCRMFFDDVCYRIQSVPNFSDAFKWTWSKVKDDYVLHLEDDWLLLRKVDLKDILWTLHSEPDLALLRLPQFRSGANSMKNWNLYFPYNGVYFECPEILKMEAGFCGHPSIIKGSFVKSIAPHIDTKTNPEKQFHRGPKEIMCVVKKWRYGVYAKPDEPPAIADLGRKWMVENKLRKKGNKAWFTQWEKEDQ